MDDSVVPCPLPLLVSAALSTTAFDGVSSEASEWSVTGTTYSSQQLLWLTARHRTWTHCETGWQPITQAALQLLSSHRTRHTHAKLSHMPTSKHRSPQHEASSYIAFSNTTEPFACHRSDLICDSYSCGHAGSDARRSRTSTTASRTRSVQTAFPRRALPVQVCTPALR